MKFYFYIVFSKFQVLRFLSALSYANPSHAAVY
nr:MAG TPA: hypothetical protein [Caudoviricetes sp.]